MRERDEVAAGEEVEQFLEKTMRQFPMLDDQLVDVDSEVSDVSP